MNLVDLDPATIVDDAGASELELLCDAVVPSALSNQLLKKLLDDVSKAVRFERFVVDVAELLTIEHCEARRHLELLGDSARWTPGFIPGMSVIHLERSSLLTPAITGFVRLLAGTCFPDHEHLGKESIFVLQGSCVDSDRIVRPGDRLTMPAGSSHSFVVRPGPDLVYLAVVERGLRIGEHLLLADDGRL